MIADAALDAALAHIRETGSRIDMLSRKADSYEEAMAASIGYTTQFEISGPQSTRTGRKCVIGGIGDGTVTRAGKPICWVLTGQGRLLAGGAIANAPAYAPGIAFRLPPLECALDREMTHA